MKLEGFPGEMRGTVGTCWPCPFPCQHLPDSRGPWEEGA